MLGRVRNEYKERRNSAGTRGSNGRIREGDDNNDDDVRFHVLMAAGMKFRVFWDVTPFKLTQVSEVRTATIIRAP
jgi:predicted ThiF/HesA family dinucleotide-utilizing enzyme